MCILAKTIFNECEKHFEKSDAKYYSHLYRIHNGAGYLIINRTDWEKQSTDQEKFAVIQTRLNTLFNLISTKASA